MLRSSSTVSISSRMRAVRPASAAVEAEADIVGDAQMRKQRAILRHEADAAPMGRDAPTGRRPERAPSSVIWPTSGASKPAMRRSSVVLPEPDGPTIAVRLPARHLEVDAVERRDRAVALADRLQREKAHRPAIRLDCA